MTGAASFGARVTAGGTGVSGGCPAATSEAGLMAVAAGRIRPEDVTPDLLRSQMPSLSVGDPDLVIRTGGERRISNFLLYGLAYAELYFADVLWPDFSERDLFLELGPILQVDDLFVDNRLLQHRQILLR